jgi:hypothetical protein
MGRSAPRAAAGHGLRRGNEPKVSLWALTNCRPAFGRNDPPKDFGVSRGTKNQSAEMIGKSDIVT